MSNKSSLASVISGFLNSPISSFYLEKDVVGHITKIFLVKKDGQCLSLYNDMVDLSERLEEGCLMASLCDKPLGQEIAIKPAKKLDRGSLKFLFFTKNGNFNPSGVMFRFCEEENENYIVVGAAPFTLVFLSDLYPETKAPEYDLSSYQLGEAEVKGDGGTIF
ncbi:hypothetical protein QFX18_05970 [Saccharophagus degradans]|uniref:hypothetical protein n=1 Tax=Saccharophagus degradans TaxID=86304 RepID=UPI002477ED6D|nr:hypothetical protein [Saccharophagus degradans]WGO99609.1 hypothetical protein QFX18_05970 [Saccharophagus degradans]